MHERPGHTATRPTAVVPVGTAFGATVLWSAGNLLTAGASLPGAQLAFWRVLGGALLYQAVFGLRGGRMSLATFRVAALGGVGFGLSASLFFVALQATTVASATVIAALQPVLLMPYAVRRLGDRVDAVRFGLVLVAVGGTALVVAGAAGGTEGWSLWGDLFALAGTVAGCLYFVGTKAARETLGALEYQAAALPVGAAVALVGALLSGPGLTAPDRGDLALVVVLTLVPGTGHLLMSWAQKHLDVTTTSTIALDVTVLSSLGAAVVYDQGLGAVQVVGMVVVLGALAAYVSRTTGGPPAADPAEVGPVPGE